MGDLDLLRRFEPVACFSADERFHPLGVEAYLEHCALFRKRPGLLRWLGGKRCADPKWEDSSGGARASSLHEHDASHYLRFLDQRAWREEKRRQAVADEGLELGIPLVGLLVLLALVVGVSLALKWIFGWGWTAPAWAIGITATIVGVTAAQMAIRARYGSQRSGPILTSAISIVAFAALIWAWRSGETSTRLVVGLPAGMLVIGALAGWIMRAFSASSARFLRLVVGLPLALLIVYAIAATVAGQTWAVGLVSVAAVLALLPFAEQAASAVMEILSPLRLAAGRQAEEIEKALRENADSESSCHPYYGRVWRAPDGSRIVLQYFFFYAFNDWRSQGGINFHEADWEGAMISLRKNGDALEPDRVAVFQHHAREVREWSRAKRLGEHPLLYVAAGSHATYLERGRKPLPDMVEGGLRRRIVGMVARFGEQSQEAAYEGRETASRRLGLDSKEPEPPDVSVADVADGEGLVIGPESPPDVEAERRREWRPVLIGDDTSWVAFEGLWGLRTRLRNESGPPGPKWKREEDRRPGVPDERLAWSDPAALFSDALEHSE